MSVATHQKVFISYRREETAGHAGRLYDALADRFGQDSVFMDVELPPGIDFVEHITQAVGSCDVLLAVIGPRWTTITGADGTRRIEVPDDFVRLEVETALHRRDIVVIPLLVGGARVPQLDDLPIGLRSLARRNALELSDGRWRYDINRLIDSLEPVLGEGVVDHGPVSRREPEPEPEPARDWAPRTPGAPEGWAGTALLLAVVTALAGFVGRGLASVLRDYPDVQGKAARIVDFTLHRTITWAVVGAVVAVAFGRAMRGTWPTAERALSGLVVGALFGAVGGLAYALPANLATLTESTDKLLLVVALAINAAGVGAAAHPGPQRRLLALTAAAIAGALGQIMVLDIELLKPETEMDRIRTFLLMAGVVGGFVALALLPGRSDRRVAPRAAARPR
jgi:TIR domain-containing protein